MVVKQNDLEPQPARLKRFGCLDPRIFCWLVMIFLHCPSSYRKLPYAWVYATCKSCFSVMVCLMIFPRFQTQPAPFWPPPILFPGWFRSQRVHGLSRHLPCGLSMFCTGGSMGFHIVCFFFMIEYRTMISHYNNASALYVVDLNEPLQLDVLMYGPEGHFRVIWQGSWGQRKMEK